MNKKQYMMMAAFLCATTTSMAAPVNVTTEQSYNAKALQTEGHAPLETSASVVSSDKEYRLRQGDELTIQVVQQADLGTRNGNDIKLGGVRVYVFGEINKPGAYTLTKSSTVIDAIGAAGSFNWDTAKKKIYLIHQDNPEKPIPINLNRMLQTGDMSENYIMREGDVLYLTKNSRINFARDIAPILTGAYMVSRIGKD